MSDPRDACTELRSECHYLLIGRVFLITLSLSEEMGWGEFRWSLYAIRSEVPRYKDARGDLYLVKERSKRSPARGLP
jgi:hypothetical protein